MLQFRGIGFPLVYTSLANISYCVPDNFAMETALNRAMPDFRQEFEDVLMKESGSELRRAVIALINGPGYQDAHSTDDYFTASMFVAGLCGSFEDVSLPAKLGVEDWELCNMCNSQFTLR
jgi:hypothetical protein